MYTFDLTKTNCLRCISNFCDKYEYPKEAKECFIDTFEKLATYVEGYDIFIEQVKKYEENIEQDYPAFFDVQTNISEKIGVHTYTLQMVYLILISAHLHDLYIINSYPEDIYNDSVLDLKWKLFECKQVYDVWGIFVAWWTIGFFKLKRFGIGRLQFNLRPFPFNYSDKNFTVSEGELTLDTHIPSCGPLVREDYLESYRKAEIFFKEHFKKGYTVFNCNSWLLSPNNRIILPAKSRIREFADDYLIIKTTDDPTNSNLWRIFYKFTASESYDNLPTDTSLQRDFLKWLKNGNNIGTAYGLIFSKNGKILN